MLASRNDYFVESSSKQISELQMVVGQNVAQVKSLTVQLNQERKQNATNCSVLKKLTAQVKDIQDGWSEMKVQLAASQKELAAFDNAFTAKSKFLDDLTKQVADLEGENEASEAKQGEFQGKGLEEGYHSGLEAQPSARSEERLTLLDTDFTLDPVVDPATKGQPVLELLQSAGDGDENRIRIGQLPLGQRRVNIAVPAPNNVADRVIISDNPVVEQTVADETSIQEAIHASSVSFAMPTEFTSSADGQTRGKN